MFESVAIILLAVVSCFLGFVLGLKVAAVKSKVGTPSASHNNQSVPSFLNGFDSENNGYNGFGV